MINVYVIILLDIDGFHYYPGAPDDVSFLRDLHRHTFRIKANFAVCHCNREKEIFILRDKLRNYLIGKYGYPANFGEMSCENIAVDILNNFTSDNINSCEVFEEYTGGALVING